MKLFNLATVVAVAGIGKLSSHDQITFLSLIDVAIP